MLKKTLKLDFQGDFDFIVAGLSCGYKDFRLCFELNLALNLKFVRNEDVIQPTGRLGSTTKHSYYSFVGNDNEVYHIISNKDSDLTGFFIPELKTIDYFLVISGAAKSFDLQGMITEIRKINLVSGIYEINHRDLKSVDSFLILIEQ